MLGYYVKISKQPNFRLVFIMHHTIDKIPNENDKKYPWQKKHLENQTGTENSFKPVKIRKNEIKKKYDTWK